MSSQSERRSNFLLIVTDQQRADHLSCAGNPILRTPNIDALAARGRRFERFYVSIPICMPNRATLFTGRMPSVHGAHCNGAPLRLSANTLLWLLREAGYRTKLVGKAHLQNMTGRPASMPRPVARGRSLSPRLAEAWIDLWNDGRYDQENSRSWQNSRDHGLELPYYGFEEVELCTLHGDVVGGDYLRWAEERHAGFASLSGPTNAAADPRYRLPQAYRTRVPEALYPTNYVVERTIAAIEEFGRTPNRPFFLTASFPDPHHPFTPPGRYWDMYAPDAIPLPTSFATGSQGMTPPLVHMHAERAAGTANTQSTLPFTVDEREAREAIALTYGMISMIDDGVGRIVAALAAMGLADDTIVIFMSDHGDFMGDHGLMLKAGLHYQGLVRVPFIWAEPGLSTPGAATSALHSTVDIARTILETAGVAPFWGMQGASVRPALDAPQTEGHDAILIEEDGHEVAMGFDGPVRVRSIVTRRWRLSIYEGVDWGELYDLAEDPDEIHNLYESGPHTATRAGLTEKLARLMMAHADRSPFPTGRA